MPLQPVYAVVAALSTTIAAGPMQNLLIPKWQPTYNLTQSTMTQTCFGPVTIGQPAPVLNATTGAFLKQWGIVALDFETEENIWANHRPVKTTCD